MWVADIVVADADRLPASTVVSPHGRAGKAEDALWVKSQDLLSQVKLLPAGQDPKSYYTNEFLPPASAMRACK